MLKINIRLQSLVRPKIFWPTIIILLITSVTFYVLKEKERSLRISKESELNKTIEAKKVVENNLIDAQRVITERDEQIKVALDKFEKEMTTRKETEAQLVLVTKEKVALEAKLEELVATSKPIELEKIIVKATPTLTGKILSFDKEKGFVVIDLGNANNLKLGDILSVYRNETFIGKVQVEKIEEKTSAAVILPEWKNVEFKEGDVIKKS